MPKRDKLFQLVRSLSKTEKRYFSIYTQLHAKSENNDYLKLFREFERQETLDEGKIKLNLAGERLLNHYAVTKSYLYDLILKAMRSYSKHSEDKRVLDLIQDVEFLTSKGIFDQALLMLQKAKEIAEQNGLLANLDLLLHWEKRIHLASRFVYFDDQRLQTLGGEQLDVQQKRRIQNKLWVKNAMLTGKTLGRNYDFDPLLGFSEMDWQFVKALKSHARNELPITLIEVKTKVANGQLEEGLQILNSVKKSWLEQKLHMEFPLLFIQILVGIMDLLFEMDKTKELDQELQAVQKDSEWNQLNDFVAAWVRCAPIFYAGYRAALQRDELNLRQFLQAWDRRPILDQLYLFGYETKATFFVGYSCFLRRKFEDAEHEFAAVCKASGDWYCLSTLFSAWIFRLICQMEMGSWKKIIRLAERFRALVDEHGSLNYPKLSTALDLILKCTNGNEVAGSLAEFKNMDWQEIGLDSNRVNLLGLTKIEWEAHTQEDLNPSEWK